MNYLAFFEHKLCCECVTRFVVDTPWRSFAFAFVYHGLPRNFTGKRFKHTPYNPYQTFTFYNPREITTHKHSRNVNFIWDSVTRLRGYCCHASHRSSIDGYMVNKVK